MQDKRGGIQRGVSLATVGVAVIALVAAGVVAGALLVEQEPPSSAAGPTGPRYAPVSQETYDGSRRVTATPVLGDAESLEVAAFGRVRASTCARGAELVSGTSPLLLDDRPVVALATTQPLWRDLFPGSRGDDVLALQAELARLGHAIDADGVYGPGTRDAVRALMSELGVDRPTGSVSASHVLWLPEPEVIVAECALTVGDTFTGGPVATVGGGLAALELNWTDAFDGWQVRFNGVAASVDDERLVTDRALLDEVLASPLWQAVGGEDGGVLELEAALAEPVRVAVVPPAALFGITGDRACVLGDDGDVRAVHIVTSALGQSLVEVDGAVPSQVVLGDEGRSCP